MAREWENTVAVSYSIADKVLPHTPSWEGMHEHDSTVIIVEDPDGPFPKRIILPVNLGMLVLGGPTEAHYKRFGGFLEVAIKERSVGPAYLVEPTALALVEDNWMLYCGVFSDYTREQLNERHGFPYFAEDGEMAAEW